MRIFLYLLLALRECFLKLFEIKFRTNLNHVKNKIYLLYIIKLRENHYLNLFFFGIKK